MSQRIEKLLAELKAERDVIAAQSAPLRAQMSELRTKIQPIETQIYQLQQQVKAIEGDSLVLLDKQIGQLHRAMGARSMTAGAVETEA